jgi:hypothetical protein
MNETTTTKEVFSNPLLPCVKCQTLAHLSALNTCPACVSDWVSEYRNYHRRTPKPNGYTLTLWADGFGRWHARANFSPALGNTGEADRVAANALAAAKRNIRQNLAARQGQPLGRLAYEVTANTFTPGIGTLSSITISEK